VWQVPEPMARLADARRRAGSPGVRVSWLSGGRRMAAGSEAGLPIQLGRRLGGVANELRPLVDPSAPALHRGGRPFYSLSLLTLPMHPILVSLVRPADGLTL
jgi:hypothetical protein